MGLIERLKDRSQQVSSAAEAASRAAKILGVGKAAVRPETADAIARIEAEFARGGFDGLVNGLNRLPRPLLMLGVVAVGAYAMLDPAGLAARAQALAGMPEPLWWLSGAMLGLHFIGREGHYWRNRLRGIADTPELPVAADDGAAGPDQPVVAPAPEPPVVAVPQGDGFADNAALRDWAAAAAAAR